MLEMPTACTEEWDRFVTTDWEAATARRGEKKLSVSDHASYYKFYNMTGTIYKNNLQI